MCIFIHTKSTHNNLYISPSRNAAGHKPDIPLKAAAQRTLCKVGIEKYHPLSNPFTLVFYYASTVRLTLSAFEENYIFNLIGIEI